jgi:hypothetical protein
MHAFHKCEASHHSNGVHGLPILAHPDHTHNWSQPRSQEPGPPYPCTPRSHTKLIPTQVPRTTQTTTPTSSMPATSPTHCIHHGWALVRLIPWWPLTHLTWRTTLWPPLVHIRHRHAWARRLAHLWWGRVHVERCRRDRHVRRSATLFFKYATYILY